MSLFYTTEYDKRLSQIRYKQDGKEFPLYFQPWVGKDYSQQKKKIFVIGMAYKKNEGNTKPNEANLETLWWPRDWYPSFIAEHSPTKSPKRDNRFNYAISALLLNRLNRPFNPFTLYAEILQPELESLWQRIALTNFTQTEACNPDQETYRRSQYLMNEICKIIGPTHIVLVSQLTQQYKPNYIEEQNLKILEIYHPTAAFAKEKFRDNASSYQATIESWEL